jgi:hypothetical protein
MEKQKLIKEVFSDYKTESNIKEAKIEETKSTKKKKENGVKQKQCGTHC